MLITNAGFNHFHDAEYEVQLPKGTGENLLILLKSEALFILNGKDIIVPKNSYLLYSAGTPQYYRSAGKSFSNDWINFLADEGEMDKFCDMGIPFDVPVSISNVHQISFLIKCIVCEAYSSNIYKQSTMNNYMNVLFNKLSESASKTDETVINSGFETLSAIRSRIYSRPYEHLSVDSVAKEAMMSRSNFQHLYKKHFDISFTDDMINSRIEYAKCRLMDTDLPAAEIAEICGYNNFSHFARQFRNRTGLTPTQYRVRKKGKD